MILQVRTNQSSHKICIRLNDPKASKYIDIYWYSSTNNNNNNNDIRNGIPHFLTLFPLVEGI